MAFRTDTASQLVVPTGGPPGLRGQSAYQAWLADGNTGALADFLGSLRGADGAKGIDGAGTITTLIATSRILPSSAVVPDGQFGAVAANPANPAHAGLVMGVTALGAEAGALVTIQGSGDLDGVSGNFAAGDTLFPSTNGTLTSVVPTTGWRQAVGKSSSSGRMVVNIGPARILSDELTILPTSDVDAIKALLVTVLTPDVLGPLIQSLGRSLPFLPEDGTVSSAGGLYRRGSGEIYDIVVVEPQS